MKINVLSPGFYRSGGLLTIYDYSNHLVERGHKVTLYIPKKIYNSQMNKFQPIDFLRRLVRRFRIDRESYISELHKYNFKVNIVPVLKNKYIQDADITIATAWPTALDLYKYDKNKGVKVYFIQDYEVWNSNIEFVDMSYKLFLNRIVTCNYLHDLLMNKFNVHSEVVFNSINTDRFDNKHKCFNDKIVLLFIFSEAERKNVKMILQSLHYIHDKYPSAVIKAFGFYKSMDLPDYIQYFENPTLDEKINLFCTSDIFLMSSNFEGFSLPPAEAMACKCAVVSTDVGAVSEYSENNVSSLLVPAGDVSKFTESIEFLINNRNELERISNAGYFSVREKLNYENSVDKFENLLKIWIKD
jgi:hypothetical protein